MYFKHKSINHTIGVLLDLLQPTTRAATTNTATRRRVSEGEAQRPRVDNNNNNNNVRPPRVVRLPRVNNDNDAQTSRVLQQKAKIHQQKIFTRNKSISNIQRTQQTSRTPWTHM